VRGELDIKPFVTHEFKGIENVNQLVDALHGGDCLRAILNIGEFKLKEQGPQISQLENIKIHGGYVKRIKHTSKVNNCDMTFSIYIPEVKKRS